jgi:hypothetical protein
MTMSKPAKFTETPIAQVEQRHGPCVPLYELGSYTPTARHDAAPSPAPVAVSVAPPKESPSAELLVSQRRRAIDGALADLMTAIGGLQQKFDALDAGEPPRSDATPEVLKLERYESIVGATPDQWMGFASRQARERDIRLHNEEQTRRFDALKKYLKSPVRASELDYKHRKFLWES